ncbi:hypothetical protein PBC5_gp37 [Sinorhizobium phage PBC5]|uniref:hypothetical protein n=1 Tax=Sinorhizobium phage PBC5 TaxID=179237 RepID=UPI001BE70B3E|nr:hypothetical protein PBC5_gp37 [Sinorhizobium phage PBC5]
MNHRDLPRTTVNDLAFQNEERQIASYFERARHIVVDTPAAVESLNKMARSKVWWIRQNRDKRSKHDVATQESYLAVLVQLHDYLKLKGKGGLNATNPVG